MQTQKTKKPYIAVRLVIFAPPLGLPSTSLRFAQDKLLVQKGVKSKNPVTTMCYWILLLPLLDSNQGPSD